MMNASLLIVEDDALLASTFQRFLQGAGYRVDVAGDYKCGRELLRVGSYNAVFMDINLQGSRSGIDLLKEIREIDIVTPVVIITGLPEVATAAAAVRNAAFDYLCKPVEKKQLLEIAQAAVRHKALAEEKEQQHRNLESALKCIKTAVDGADIAAKAKAPAGNCETVLSEREAQIFFLLGQGESTADIASHFAISTRTVESYYARIIEKLSLDGMKVLRRYAIRNKNRH